jgi:hypothetical protein
MGTSCFGPLALGARLLVSCEDSIVCAYIGLDRPGTFASANSRAAVLGEPPATSAASECICCTFAPHSPILFHVLILLLQPAFIAKTCSRASSLVAGRALLRPVCS